MRIVIFALFCFGFILLLNISFSSVFNMLFKEKHKEKDTTKKRQTIKSWVDELSGTTKQNAFKKARNTAEVTLAGIGQKEKFKQVHIAAVLLSICGAIIGILLKNIFLAGVLCAGFYFIPLWLTKFSVYKYTRDINNELCVALSAVTTSYIRSNDFVAAVEENINYMQGAVYKAFRNFLKAVQLNPNITASLLRLHDEIDSNLFQQWVDTVILCQQDHQIKYALPGIVRKFNDLKKLQMENETRMTMPLKYALIIVITAVLFIPGISLLNAEWYAHLMHTIPGQIIVAADAVVCLLTINKAIKLSGPIEFSI